VASLLGQADELDIARMLAARYAKIDAAELKI
jgi:hypothetical protein